MKYHLIQLGCQMNISDGERIRTVIESLGYEPTEREEEANLLGIVACSVRQKAIDKVYSKIHAWNLAKHQRSLLTFISGCILPADKVKFLKLFDLVFHMAELPQLPDLIRQYGVVTPAAVAAAEEATYESFPGACEGRETASPAAPGIAVALSRPARSGAIPPESKLDSLSGFWKIAPHYSSRSEAYVPIQNGCDKFCTFCAVPYTRGREVSRPSEEILAEVRSLVEQGYKSITLLGQNVNSYGLDRRGAERSFARLLRAVGEIGIETGRDFWTYFTSPHPRDMTDEVLEVIAEYPVLAKQIHLPIQSGDDKVLIRMNRNYRFDQYRSVVESIRRILPEATLFTDIIVGFSGESEEQFERTRAAMRLFQYHMAYIAIYSPRPGAASARWEDDVPHEEKKRRLHELQDELQAISLRHNQALVGRTVRVLVSGRDRLSGHLSGRTEGKIIVRFPSDDESLIGRFVGVTISSAAEMAVAGELVADNMSPVDGRGASAEVAAVER